MKENKHNIKRWLFWFSLALSIIVAFNVLSNLAGVGKWIKNLIDILRPFCLGLLIAYILYLPCRHIETLYSKKKNKKRKMSFINKHARGLSIVTTYIIAIILLSITLNVVMPVIGQSVTDLFANLPKYYNDTIEKINNLPEDNILRSEKVTEIIQEIKNINFYSLINIEKIQDYIKSFISAVETIIDGFIAIIVSIYILAQRTEIIKFLSKLTRATFNNKTYEKIKKYFVKANTVFFKFLTSQVLDAILVGVLVSIALLTLKVKYGVLLGIMIGLFNLIPYFGAIIAIIIAILITLLTGGIGQALLMTVIVVILQQIDANIINPKIVGNSLDISQLLVIFSVTVGGAYFGILGMFIAVPVVTVIKLMLDDFIEERTKKRNETAKS